MPTINLTDDELVAVTATVRRAIENDRFPHAPRLDPLRAALGKFEAAPAPTSLAKAPPPAKADKRRGDNRRPFARRRYLRPSIHSVSACEPRCRVDGRFVSVPRLVTGHDALSHGVLGERGAQARHSVGEVAHVHANERALFCPV